MNYAVINKTRVVYEIQTFIEIWDCKMVCTSSERYLKHWVTDAEIQIYNTPVNRHSIYRCYYFLIELIFVKCLVSSAARDCSGRCCRLPPIGLSWKVDVAGKIYHLCFLDWLKRTTLQASFHWFELKGRCGPEAIFNEFKRKVARNVFMSGLSILQRNPKSKDASRLWLAGLSAQLQRLYNLLTY